MTNLNSVTELTEFAPLSPETKQSGVTSIFSKLFKFSQDGSGENSPRSPKSSGSSPSFTPIGNDEPSNSSWTVLSDEQGDPRSSRLQVCEYRELPHHAVEGRNLRNVLRRVGKMLASRHKNPPVYNNTNLKQYWMPDSVSKECYDCSEKFTTFRRRHHCRICGQIFCSQCCNQEVPGKIIGCVGSLRVCTYCCKVVLSYLQETDLSVDLKALQEDLISKFGDSLEDLHSQDSSSVSGLSVANETSRRKVSVVYQEEKFAASRPQINTTWYDDEPTHKSELASLNTLLQEVMYGDNPLPLQSQTGDGTKYELCFTGSHFIDWLISFKKTSSRTHSLAIGQVLLDANYIECFSSKSANFADDSTLYKICIPIPNVKEEEKPFLDEPPTRLMFENPTPSHSGFRLDLNIHKNTAHISRQPHKVTGAKDKKAGSTAACDSTERVLDEFIDVYLKLEQPNPTLWTAVNVNNLKEEHEEASAFRSLSETFQQHLQNAVNQLLGLENLSLSWSQLIIGLAEQALNEIKMDFHKTDIIHIGHYVQIKKLAGEERKDSCLIGGIVSTKDVAHREMRTHLINPRILLLNCAIVYQRVEGRLMSLEPVLMQEQEYLRNAVARIVSLRPDLVLVHRNVSRLAQESLNASGITLILNVKMSVMDRIARCTNAVVVTTVDAHVGTTQLGTCRTFYTKKFTLKDGATKTLMFFEGCAFPQLGCTILLRGASETELKKLKKVTSAVVFMYYNARLEKSFLMDEFAKPPTLPSFTFVGEVASPKRGVLSPVDTFCSTSVIKREARYSEKNKEINEMPEDVEKLKRDDSSKLEPDIRTSVKSVVASFDDPLQANFSTRDDDTSSSSSLSNSSNLPFAEVTLKQNKFKAALQDTILSFSPFIEFSLPYLETEVGLSCELRKYFPDEVYQLSRSNNKDQSRNVSNEFSKSYKPIDLNSIPRKPVHPFVTAKLRDDKTNEEVQTQLAFYRACGGRIEHQIKSKSAPVKRTVSNVETKQRTLDIFDPRNHQRLSVLFCSFSHFSNNSPEFCVNPWIVNMDFYGCHDIPLGSFLEKYCFRRSYMCPSNTCETPMIDHERRFVHDTGCLHVTLKEIDSLPDKNNHSILMWSSCSACKAVTPVIGMSSDTWNLSFAKYLELRFHAGKYNCRADSAKNCNHSLHNDYGQYFYFKNIVVSVKYTNIQLWEISLPPSIIKIRSLPVQVSFFLDQVKKWAVTGHELFSSILEKLCSNDYESSVTIQGLKKHLGKQQATFKQKVDDIQVILTSSGLTDSNDEETMQKYLWKLEDSVVFMKKSVAEALLDWNAMLIKLDSRKRDDKQKHKSLSDASEGKPSVNSVSEETALIDEMNMWRSKKEDKSLSDSSMVDSTFLEANRNENIDSTINEKEQSNTTTEDDSDAFLQPSNMNTSNETVSSGTQTQAPDKMTVKNLLSQLLPNTFQNPGSVLFNPINSDEHYVVAGQGTIPLVVYESEPSSIISYALSSYQYSLSFEEIVAKNATSASEHVTKSTAAKKETTDGISVTGAVDSPQVLDNDDPAKGDGTEESKTRSVKIDSGHIEVQFSDATANFTVKVYFAEEFKKIRDLVFAEGEEAFVRSLSRCVPWAAHGGKSGSSFCKTKDDRFILKGMARLEIQPFLEIAPHYFNYIRSCHNSQQATLLVKIVGVYRVKFRNAVSNQAFHSNLLVMENLFYARDIIRKFDLKGSVRNRLVNTKSSHEGELVLLDENLINMTCACPLYIYPHSKTVLMKAINSDVAFLASQSVMDYSLLVGVDETSQELVVGIIDYIRTFTWDKKLETIVKKSGLLGGQGKLPTIISPEDYKKRFIAAMHKYFLAVPDQWLGFGKNVDY